MTGTRGRRIPVLPPPRPTSRQAVISDIQIAVPGTGVPTFGNHLGAHRSIVARIPCRLHPSSMLLTHFVPPLYSDENQVFATKPIDLFSGLLIKVQSLCTYYPGGG